MSMYGVIGKYEPEMLLADPMGADPIAIACTPGKGKVEMGTVMYRESNGMYSPAAAAQAVDSNDLVVISQAVDTDADESIAENASAYRGGNLLQAKVKLADGAELTPAIILTLRKQGIVLSQMVGAEEFNNSLN